MSVNITLNTDGPRDPLYVLEVAEALSQSVRVLNHLTRSHEALEFPSEADTLLRYVQAAADGLPQLLGQLAEWLAAEQAAGRIVMEGGSRGRDPGVMTDVTRLRLEQAAARARELGKALDGAASVTCDMGGVED